MDCGVSGELLAIGLTVVVHMLAAAFLIFYVFRLGGESAREEPLRAAGGGGDGPPSPQDPPRRPGPAPLPDAAPSPVRLRPPEPLRARPARPDRRPTHPARDPERSPRVDP